MLDIHIYSFSIYMHLWFNIMLCLLNLGFADTYVYTTRKQIQYLPNLGYHYCFIFTSLNPTL